MADPAVTLFTEAKVEFMCFEEKNILYQSQAHEQLVREGKMKRWMVIKYEMPDGPWLFYVVRDWEGKLAYVGRLLPVQRDDRIVVVFDTQQRDYFTQQVYEYRVYRDTSPSRAWTGHLLVGKPGQRGCYLCFDLGNVYCVFERIFVKDFAKAKLERQPDGRVILVEEK